MADTKEKQPKEPKEPRQPKQPKQPKAPKGEAPAPQAPAVPAEPAPRARLLDYYEQRVRGKLPQPFGFSNPPPVPKLKKIVLNVGMGDAVKNPKGLEGAGTELGSITGQKPRAAPAKKAI